MCKAYDNNKVIGKLLGVIAEDQDKPIDGKGHPMSFLS